MRPFQLCFSRALAGTALLMAVGCASHGLPSEPPSSTASRRQALGAAVALEGAGEGRSAAVGGGQSMAPIYGENSVIVTQPIAYGELEAGMIVAFISETKGRVIHQLTRHTHNGWKTRGLNNAEEDEGYVTAENLIGVVYGVFQSGD